MRENADQYNSEYGHFSRSADNAESPEVLTIYVRIRYYSDKGLSLLKSG